MGTTEVTRLIVEPAIVAQRPAHGGCAHRGCPPAKPAAPRAFFSRHARGRNHEPLRVQAAGLLGLLEINSLPLERQSRYFLILVRS